MLIKFKKINYSMLFVYFYILDVYTFPALKISSTINTFALYSLFGIGVLNVIIRLKQIKIYSYTKWYVIFIAWSVFSCLYAYDFNVAFNSIYNLLVVLGITIGIVYIIKSTNDIENIFICFSLSGLILFLIMVFTNQLSTDSRLGNELFGNANTLALLIMISLICSFWLIIYSKKQMKIICFFTILSELYMLSLSGGRKFFVIPILFLYLILISKTNKKRQRKIIIKTIIVVFVVVVAYHIMINVPIIYNHIGHRMESLVEALLGKGQLNNSDYVRTMMIRRGWELSSLKPILGYGINNYYLISCFNTYSHNNFIELLVNLGLIGFIIYYYFYVYLLVKLWNLNKFDKKYRDFLIGFIISLIILETGVVTYNIPLIQIFLAIGSWLLINGKK
ncbi:MAG: O-antigen ligase family protein [Clostridiaceae bacterium]